MLLQDEIKTIMSPPQCIEKEVIQDEARGRHNLICKDESRVPN